MHIYLLCRNLRRWIAHKAGVPAAAAASDSVWSVTQQTQHLQQVNCICYSSSSGILLFSRSLTPITATHHKHLSSARFFAVSYPSHMLLINCSLYRWLMTMKQAALLMERNNRLAHA